MILVVDDSAAVRAFTRTVLEGAGYKVKEAEDTAGALKALDGVDLALVDVEIGAENGFGLASRMPGIPVIMISGHEMPVIGYLKKPFSPEDLLRAVRERLGS